MESKPSPLPLDRQEKQGVCLWKRTLLSKWSLFKKENSCIHITGCKFLAQHQVKKNGGQRWWIGWMWAGRADQASPAGHMQPSRSLGDLRPALSQRCPPRALRLIHRPSCPNKRQESSHRAPGNLFQPDNAKWVKTHLIRPYHPLLATASLVERKETNQPPSFTEHFPRIARAAGRALGRQERREAEGRASVQTPLCDLRNVNGGWWRS